MSRLRHLIPVAAVSLALAGCGGGSSTTTEPVTDSTKPVAPPSTATSKRPPAPKTSSAPGKDHGGTPATNEKSRREAEADFDKYCQTHPGACGD